MDTTETIAWAISEQIGGLLAYGGDMFTWRDARRVNETTGWTLEEGGGQAGWVVRHEGVRLADDRLIVAYLRGWRRSMGWSQQELAGHLGVPPNTLARWERGALAVRHPEMLGLALDRLAGAGHDTAAAAGGVAVVP